LTCAAAVTAETDTMEQTNPQYAARALNVIDYPLQNKLRR
jgi:hypothetical protein